METFFGNRRLFLSTSQRIGGVFAGSCEWAIASILADSFSQGQSSLERHITTETFSTLNCIPLLAAGPVHIYKAHK